MIPLERLGGKKEQEKSPDHVICGLSVGTNTKQKFRGLIFFDIFSNNLLVYA